jgi:hypothetical protein
MESVQTDIPTPICTRYNNYDLYWGGAQFKSRPGHDYPGRCFVVFLNPSSQSPKTVL